LTGLLITPSNKLALTFPTFPSTASSFRRNEIFTMRQFQDWKAT